MAKQHSVFIQIKNLKKTYGRGGSENEVLRGLSLTVYKGEFLVILGSSGSGKSTLLNLIGGIDRADSGSISVGGKEITGMSERQLTEYRRTVGFVFQQYHLIPELTARENVALVCRKKKDADAALAVVGLEEKGSKYPNALSGGEQQRVAIARAVSRGAVLLLCDEPTGALDGSTGKQVMAELERLCRSKGKTVVVVTHNRELARMGDRVVSMKDGILTEEFENETPAKAEELTW